jgi:single-stranded DNA-binding protein
MRPLGVNKTVLLGVLSRPPQMHYGREGQVRALLFLTTRVQPVGAQGELPGPAIEDAHMVYCEGAQAERLVDQRAGATIYLEGRNREQRIVDPAGKSHRLAYVAATIVRLQGACGSAEGANFVTLVGTLLREPIPKFSADGQLESVKLRIATTHRQYDSSQDSPRYSHEYHWVTYYGRVAEFVLAKAHKDNLVFVEGRNQPDRWQDGEGLTHRSITIVGHYFQLLHAEEKPLMPPAPKPAELERPPEAVYGYDVQLPEEDFSFS